MSFQAKKSVLLFISVVIHIFLIAFRNRNAGEPTTTSYSCPFLPPLHTRHTWLFKHIMANQEHTFRLEPVSFTSPAHPLLLLANSYSGLEVQLQCHLLCGNAPYSGSDSTQCSRHSSPCLKKKSFKILMLFQSS